MARPSADRELADLRVQNARLSADVDRQRRQLRRAQQSKVVPRRPDPPLTPFQIPDPRQRPRKGTVVLPELTPPLKVGREMGAAIAAELRTMAIEARALLKRLAQQPNAAMDAISDDAQHEIRQLQYRWQKRFDSLAVFWSARMIDSVIAQSDAQLNLNLREIADRTVIQSTLATPRMRAILEASTQANVGLITRIPEKFLGAVQTRVMSAITTGAGLADLVPYLTKKYKGDARHAHLTALDQIRKVSESVNATRLQSLGVEEYVWMHTGGERYPRKLHMSYSGKTFRYDKPPIIDERTKVRGKPGDAIGCRCRQRPVLNFTKIGA